MHRVRSVKLLLEALLVPSTLQPPATATNSQTKPCGPRAPRRPKTATAAIRRSPSPNTLPSLRPHTFVKLGPARCNPACNSQAWEVCNTAPVRACIPPTRLHVNTCPKLRQVRSRPRNNHGQANTHSPNSGGHLSSNSKNAACVAIAKLPS